MQSLPGTPDPPSMKLDLSNFQDTETLYATSATSNDAQEQPSLAQCYASAVNGAGALSYLNNVTRTYYNESDMDSYLVDVAKASMYKYNQYYLIAAEMDDTPNDTAITGFYNNEAYHAIAISLSYINNALLKYHAGDGYRIETFNHPLPWSLNSKVNNDVNDSMTVGFIFSYCLMFGMAFLIGTFVVFLINERSSGAKHSQFVSGVSTLNFWVSTFSWDFINYLVPAILIIIVIKIFDVAANPGLFNFQISSLFGIIRNLIVMK